MASNVGGSISANSDANDGPPRCRVPFTMYASSPASRSIPTWYSTDRSDRPVRRTRYSIPGRQGDSCASSWATRTVVAPKLRGPCDRCLRGWYSPDPATQWTACIQE
ncbi:hypothetical protein [Streptomyces sp. enrichment culture]|uniref:hypothetical protein n=1 Tax=Streptomyces sp. enrichment culture TaxID=1795815 RepID=UPI003F5441E1